jgi:hypothetical protein
MIAMNHYFRRILTFLMFLLCINSFASSLADDARNRGINETCSNYLSQVDESFDLNGFNITFAHPEEPSKLSSHHISMQKYNNASSVFSATLTPDGESCNHSTVLVTSVNDKTCLEIAKQKKEIDSTLQPSSYADGGFITLTSSTNNFQIILISSDEKSCTIVEARMIWPGK